MLQLVLMLLMLLLPLVIIPLLDSELVVHILLVRVIHGFEKKLVKQQLIMLVLLESVQELLID